jgi:hypothetical protein
MIGEPFDPLRLVISNSSDHTPPFWKRIFVPGVNEDCSDETCAIVAHGVAIEVPLLESDPEVET